MTNFLQMLLEKRKSLQEHISNAQDFIDATCDASSTVEVAANIPDTNYVLNFVNGEHGRLLKVFDSSIQDDSLIETINITNDNADVDLFISSLQMKMGSVISKINESTTLNAVIAHLNDAMLNYGEIGKEGALEVINMYDPSSNNESTQQLRSMIATISVDKIGPTQWASLLYNLDNPVKDTLENNSLVLDETTTSIKMYVGSAIIGVLATALQFAAILLVGVSKVLGFILAVVGSAASWVYNTISQAMTTFSFNFDSIDRNINTPIKAAKIFVQDSDEPWYDPNGGGKLISFPFGDLYFWTTKTGNEQEGFSTLSYNFFPSANLHPDRTRRWLRSLLGITDSSIDSLDTGTTKYLRYSFKVTNFFNTIGYTLNTNLSDDTLSASVEWSPYYSEDWAKVYNIALNNFPDSIYMTDDEVADNLNNSEFWYKAIISSTALFECLNLCGLVPYQRDGAISTGVCPCTASISTLTPTLAAPIVLNILSDAEASTANALYASLGSHLPDMYKSSLIEDDTMEYEAGSFYSLSNWAYANDSEVIPTVMDNSFMAFLDIWYDLGSNTVSYCADKQLPISQLPERHFITWPSYSLEALTNTLKLAAIGLTIGAAIGFGVKLAKTKWIPKMKQRAVLKLNEARSNYESTGSEAALDRYINETRKYNFKASLFGWQTYDSVNGWFDYKQSTESSSATTSIKNIYETNDISKLIRGNL